MGGGGLTADPAARSAAAAAAAPAATLAEPPATSFGTIKRRPAGTPFGTIRKPAARPSPVPAYLASPDPDGQHTWGSLEYDEHGQSWVIRGEPAVVEMAKRLFPGSEGRGQGVAKFPATKRAAGDLNWLMLRFPLRIRAPERWQEARAAAVEHAMVRLYRNRRRERAAPPPGFDGELFVFQEQGLAYLLNNDRCLLADAAGTGKTPTALAWLATLRAYPAVVVVQPHMVAQWTSEAANFVPEARVHTVRGLKPSAPPEADIYLVHYLLLRAWHELLVGLGPEAVVFDEIQELRHSETMKYSAASLLAGASPRVVGLSGTPIHNRGGEMWQVLNILDYHCLGDYDAFTREWCDGYGSDVVRNPRLLGDYLRREGLMLRRTKEQVLSELPPKRRVVQRIDVDRALYGSLIAPAVELALQTEGEKDAFARGRLTREAINESRRVTGIAKARYVCAFVRALLEAGETVLLFAYHHDVWDLYGKALAEFEPVRITGRETPAEKDRSVKAFMGRDATIAGSCPGCGAGLHFPRDYPSGADLAFIKRGPRRCEDCGVDWPAPNLVMISLRAASGLNLQRATCVVFGELDWSPAVHSQGEDRAHRIGQKDSVLCYYLACDEGTDQDMIEALGLKVSQFLGIMGDKPESEQDRAIAQSVATEHMKRVIERLKARGRSPPPPEPPPEPEPLDEEEALRLAS